MILTAANILMYAAGAPHPHKDPSVAFLNRVAAGKVDAVIDAEILQEILHRYRSLNRWDEGQKVFDASRRLFPTVLPITGEIMDEAKRILSLDATTSARDAVHAAVLNTHKLGAICTFDTDFDRIPGCRRVNP